jgi:hypothetical protein
VNEKRTNLKPLRIGVPSGEHPQVPRRTAGRLRLHNHAWPPELIHRRIVEGQVRDAGRSNAKIFAPRSSRTAMKSLVRRSLGTTCRYCSGAGSCDHLLKVKNRKHPAFSRVVDQF